MLTESVQLSNEIGTLGNIYWCLDIFAALAAAQGQYARAAQLEAASIALMDSNKFSRTDWDRETQEQRMAGIQRQMAEPEFARAVAQGRAMTREQAAAYALEAPAIEQTAEPPTSNQAAKREFGGLTVRERQVASHIAQGESNKEIAKALVLSERTVETHVTNILNKLGFTTRAQIRRWAVGKALGR
jgi:non-specific serine/threonine protein kinase